jgi:hypothetical protein
MPKIVTDHEFPDFWDQFPDAGLIPEFEALRNKRKEKSSDLMWYIRLRWDPSHEFLRVIKPEDRDAVLKKRFGVAKADLDSALFVAADKHYQYHYLSDAHRMYRIINEKILMIDDMLGQHFVASPREVPEILDAIKSRMELAKRLDEARQSMEAINSQKREERTKMFGKREDVRPADAGDLF